MKTEQERKNRQFARILAALYYGTMGMENVPIVLNSQQCQLHPPKGGCLSKGC